MTFPSNSAFTVFGSLAGYSLVNSNSKRSGEAWQSDRLRDRRIDRIPAARCGCYRFLVGVFEVFD
jgi:hypothetical protein